jgi:hypothetical protein
MRVTGLLQLSIRQGNCTACKQWGSSIFGPKGDEVTQGWKKSNNEEGNNLYSFLSIDTIIK